MTPAIFIIEKFGGVRALARTLKLSPSTIMGWKTSKKRRGTGGKIPNKHHEKIMKIAKKRRMKITASNLLFGKKIK